MGVWKIECSAGLEVLKKGKEKSQQNISLGTYAGNGDMLLVLHTNGLIVTTIQTIEWIESPGVATGV